jgi:hypothetical protein
MLLGVRASNDLDALMVGYLQELFWEGALVGPNMLMRQALTAGPADAAPDLKVVFDGIPINGHSRRG